VSGEPRERDPDEVGGIFRFRAGILTEYDYDPDDGEMKLTATYRVDLPHQCDAWKVVDTADRAEAIERMETFVREAEQALRMLRDAV
jgi:hypothetical protein